jgi:hypothetical protein
MGEKRTGGAAKRASQVAFASAQVNRLNARNTLPAKLRRMLQGTNWERFFKGKSVAVKMHVGSNIGYSTLHPLFVRIAVEEIKAAGGRPFITDGSWSIESRQGTARGFTEETLGAPLRPAAGVAEKYFYRHRVGYRSLASLEVCGEIADAQAMLVLSHGKGHGACGFAGAIKNIAMGCVTTRSRGGIHGLQDREFKWDRKKCTHCYACRDNCPGEAISFNEKGELRIFTHHCRYCLHCVTSCPVHAIEHNPYGWKHFQRGMAKAVKVVLDTFEPGSVYYLTALLNVTPLCDCWGFTTPALVPDIGLLGSEDIAAIEQAALDLIAKAPYIPGSLPTQLKLGEGGHLFERIWGKDPYLQVEEVAKAGLGRREYQLVPVN